jgi:hypothetical protein
VSFNVRDLQPSHIESTLVLKNEIARQCKNAHVDIDADIGYFEKDHKWVFNCEKDLTEFLKLVKDGKAAKRYTLWIHGSGEVPKRKRAAVTSTESQVCLSEVSDNSDSEADMNVISTKKRHKKKTALENKNKRVEDIIKNLKDGHTDKYTAIQFRLWAETIDIGTYSSYEECLQIPMFRQKHSKATGGGTLNEAITDIAASISVALRSKGSASSKALPKSCTSPFKAVNVQTKYLHQLKDLHALYETGGITENEYQNLKIPILENMKALMSSRKWHCILLSRNTNHRFSSYNKNINIMHACTSLKSASIKDIKYKLNQFKVIA